MVDILTSDFECRSTLNGSHIATSYVELLAVIAVPLFTRHASHYLIFVIIITDTFPSTNSAHPISISASGKIQH